MITIKIDGKEVLDAMAMLAEKVGSRETMAAVGASVAELIRGGFNDSEDPWGQAWKPLALRSGQPLRDTGMLMNSITFNVVSDNSVEVGTNICHAVTHQFGAMVRAGQPAGKQSMCGYTTKGAKRLAFKAGGKTIFAKEVNIPARPFMPIKNGTADLPPAWERTVLEALIDAIGLGK